MKSFKVKKFQVWNLSCKIFRTKGLANQPPELFRRNKNANINQIICIENKKKDDIFGTQKNNTFGRTDFLKCFCEFDRRVPNEESLFCESYLLYNTTFPIPFSIKNVKQKTIKSKAKQNSLLLVIKKSKWIHYMWIILPY